MKRGRKGSKLKDNRGLKRTKAPPAPSRAVQQYVDAVVANKIELSHDLKGADHGAYFANVSATLTNSDSSQLLNALNLGTASTKRKDARIAMRSLRVKFTITNLWTYHAINGNVEASRIRVSVVYFKTRASSMPNWNDIFRSIDTNGTVTTNFLSSVDYNKTGDYRVLRDEVIDLNPTFMYHAGLANNMMHNNYTFDWFIDLKGKEARWAVNSATAAINDFESGAVAIYFKAEKSDTHTWCAADFSSRLRYTDA